jgi:hypothetical protein
MGTFRSPPRLRPRPPARVGGSIEIPLGGGLNGASSAGGDRAARPGVSVLLRRGAPSTSSTVRPLCSRRRSARLCPTRNTQPRKFSRPPSRRK